MPKRSALARRRESDVLMIRNSERQSYKRCQQQWYWNFVELRKPLDEQKALRFGSLMHKALEKHYKPGKKRGVKPWVAFERLYKEEVKAGLDDFSMRGDDEKWLSALELGTAMLRGFWDKYHDQDEEWEVLSAEQVFQVPIEITPPGHSRQTVIVVGTLDGVWRKLTGARARRSVIFKEWKTTGSSIQDVISNLPMDEQAGTYWTFAPQWLWKLGILPEGKYPDYIWYTILYKALPDERPENHLGQKLNKPTAAQAKAGLPGDVSKKQPATRFGRQPVYRDAGDRERMTQRVTDEAIDMWLARRGLRPIIKNPGPLYMPNCRGCPFRDPCELHETGNDYESMIRAHYGTWEPYAAHELPERW